jgi:hypothetical protein
VPVEEALCEAFVLLPPVVPEAEVDLRAHSLSKEIGRRNLRGSPGSRNSCPCRNSSSSSTGGSSTIETVAICY